MLNVPCPRCVEKAWEHFTFPRPRLISLAQLLSWREHQMRRACKHVKHNWEGNFIQQLFQIYFDNYRLQQLVLVNLVSHSHSQATPHLTKACTHFVYEFQNNLDFWSAWYEVIPYYVFLCIFMRFFMCLIKFFISCAWTLCSQKFYCRKLLNNERLLWEVKTGNG